jgi:hypothetical protein
MVMAKSSSTPTILTANNLMNRKRKWNEDDLEGFRTDKGPVIIYVAPKRNAFIGKNFAGSTIKKSKNFTQP